MHCNYTIFYSKFCAYIEGKYPWNEVDQQKAFLFEPASCSASDQFRRDFLTVQNRFEKRIKPLINSIGLRIKRHTSFFLFLFCNLKLVLID